MIVVTGAAGFIASCLAGALNEEGYRDLVLVDDFGREEKKPNYEGKRYVSLVERDVFFGWLKDNHRYVELIFHLGARSDTTEANAELLRELNLGYTQRMWSACVEYGLPLVYASSAATYGGGEHGYSDSHELVERLTPLNLYGKSKNDFDRWALQQQREPFFWAGLKFFNVYGPNEYHKQRMASVVLHAYNQIRQTGSMKLFRSHNPDYPDGGQMRDFVYVKDLCNVMIFLMEQRPKSGIYNMGTGRARSFLDLVKSTFRAMDIPESITYIDTPEDIRQKYQYFTEADMGKLRSAGYTREFSSLESGVEDYVKRYLAPHRYM
ncbi:MAG: ADP-glyceromanno-heptose 6-epimerase [Prevotellaceae bacterium]|jgi:ADP-L-glycero-D-manno-heptose 6-epimerase|nr:ADP-glyceromanno-heptose 6-epimerase [Prevotellaceae bacterium]